MTTCETNLKNAAAAIGTRTEAAREMYQRKGVRFSRDQKYARTGDGVLWVWSDADRLFKAIDRDEAARF